MDSKLDTVREAFKKWMTIPYTDGEYYQDGSYLDFNAGYQAALSAIDPDAIRREEHKRCVALVEKNRFAIPIILAQVAYNNAIDDCISILSAEPAPRRTSHDLSM